MSNTKSTNIQAQGLRGCLTLFFSALLFAPAWAQQQTAAPQQTSDSLDIPALIRESDRNGAAMHQRLLEFTYIQKRTTRETGPKGKVVERVREFEAYPVKTEGRHRHVLSLIKKDGVPLSEKQIEQNRRLAVGEMEKPRTKKSLLPPHQKRLRLKNTSLPASGLVPTRQEKASGWAFRNSCVSADLKLPGWRNLQAAKRLRSVCIPATASKRTHAKITLPN